MTTGTGTRARSGASGPRMAAPRRMAQQRKARGWRMPLLVAVLGLAAVLAPVATPLGDTADPLLTGMTPAPGSVVDAGSVNVQARVDSRSSAAIRTIELRVDGRAYDAEVTGGGNLQTVTAVLELAPGPHTAQIVAWDNAGRSTQAWWRFEVTVDAGPQAAAAEETEGTASRSLSEPRGAGLDLEPEPGVTIDELSHIVIGVGQAVDAEVSSAALTIDGRDIPVTLSAEGSRLLVQIGDLPGDVPLEGTLPVRLLAGVGTQDGQIVEVDYEFSWEVPPVVETDEGFLIAAGVGPAIGEGKLFTYTLEVEPGIGVDPHEFADEAERFLSDPRSWTGQGEFALQRVETQQAPIRVVLASPDTVDRYCAEAGLDTAGEVSCWNGRFAMLNIDRWTDAVPFFEHDIDAYRTYLVNHEVGHGLGFGHVDCPAPGELAPVMQQQSLDLQGCRPNGWVYP
jgi:hypothetical protein